MPGSWELSDCGPCSTDVHWALKALRRFGFFPEGLPQTLARGECEICRLSQEADVPSPHVGSPGGPARRVAHRALAGENQGPGSGP